MIIRLPVGWRVLGILLVAGLLATAVFLTAGTYPRIETATGEINPEGGVAAIMGSRSGTIDRLAVREGQRVTKGQLLATVRVADTMQDGQAASDIIRRAIVGQEESLGDQASAALRASQADVARLRARVAGGRAQLAGLDRQISYQAELIASATADYENARTVAAKGFVSNRDVEARAATVLARKQQLAQLQQLQAAKQTEIDEARSEIERILADSESRAIASHLNQLKLAQELAETGLAGGYTIVSPGDGHVSSVTAHVGQAVTSDAPLMMIVPTGSPTIVTLHVPMAAAGLISEGQKVRIAVDAYPYQRFGTITATIASVSQAARTEESPSGQSASYLVSARLPQPFILAFGRRHHLRPGMTVSARIVVEQRSLVEWLFEPLLSVAAR